MREDLLHFIWKHKKIQTTGLYTTRNLLLTILATGTQNHLAGPDFFNARIEIDGQKWAGNVEIHIRSSDWFLHHHEQDDAYNSVILHVVWEEDVAVYRNDNTLIPTLEIGKYIPVSLLENYQRLFNKQQLSFIYCEKDLKEIDRLVWINWLERLYYERLEKRHDQLSQLVSQSKNNWEHVLFSMLLKSFGSKINGEPFLSIATALDFSTLTKIRGKPQQLESLFFGLAGILNDIKDTNPYETRLRKEYRYVCHKFDLNGEGVSPAQYFKLRPANFPTIRLSQLANLYGRHGNLLSKIVKETSLEKLYEIFHVSASAFWDTHYTFGKTSPARRKSVSKNFIDILILNTVVPIKFSYARFLGKSADAEITEIVNQIKAERNGIINNFESIGVQAKNAMESQAQLQLYNEYCSKDKCLSCNVGMRLLARD